MEPYTPIFRSNVKVVRKGTVLVAAEVSWRIEGPRCACTCKHVGRYVLYVMDTGTYDLTKLLLCIWSSKTYST